MNSFSQSWLQVGEDIEGQQNWESSGYFIAMNDGGTTVIIGAPYNDEAAEDAGKARVYHWEASSWMQRGNDIEGVNAFDNMGYSVSISSDGDIVAVGAIQDIDKQRSAGYVRVLSWDGSDWVQMGSDILGENTYDRFGTAVSLSDNGNTLAVGARSGPNGDESGSVKVYTWNGSAWVQKGQDLNGQEVWDSMGWSLGLDSEGNTLVIGTPQDGNSYPGYVQIFSWDGSSWIQKGGDIIGDANGDRFGWSTSINSTGRSIAVGARQNGGNGEQSGQLKIFTWNGSQWEQRGDAIYGSSSLQFLGWSTSISADGNTVAAGAPGMPANADDGKVQVYAWNNSQWELKGDVIMGDIGGSRAGWSVSISSGGDIVAVGTPFYTGNSGAGQVKVFTFGFTDVSDNVTETSINIYPNPADDFIMIQMDQVYRDITVRIRNITGQVILTRSFESASELELNLDFPAGMYLLEVDGPEVDPAIMKVIKLGR